jgi:hypothetical protein
MTDAHGAAAHAVGIVGLVAALASYAWAAAQYGRGSASLLSSGQLPRDGRAFAFAFAVVALLATAVPRGAFVMGAGYSSSTESVVRALDVWLSAEGTS